MEVIHKDALDRPVEVGDLVVVHIYRNRSMGFGTVSKLCPKRVRVRVQVPWLEENYFYCNQLLKMDKEQEQHYCLKLLSQE